MELRADYVMTVTPQGAEARVVHEAGCRLVKEHGGEIIELGDHDGCAAALATAREHYPHAAACAVCCPDARDDGGASAG